MIYKNINKLVILILLILLEIKKSFEYPKLFRKYDIASTEIIDSKNIKNYKKLIEEFKKLEPINKYDQCIYLTFTLFKKRHLFCLIPNQKMRNIKISIVMDNKNVNETMLKHGGTFVEGFDMRNPFSSFVNGYIYCNCFYGRIHLALHNYYVERLHKFPSIMKLNKISDTNLRKNSRYSTDYLFSLGERLRYPWRHDWTMEYCYQNHSKTNRK